MGETAFVIIDGKEKRIENTGWMSLDGILASIAKDPKTIKKFDQIHQEITGKIFYEDNNYDSKKPNETTIYDLPIKNPANMKTIFDDGVIIVDLRKKTIDYYFTTGIEVQRKKPDEIDKEMDLIRTQDNSRPQHEYEFSSEWTITKWKNPTEK